MADLAYGVATSILEKLGSIALEELSLAFGLRKDLKKLEDKTSLLRSVLLDAEKKKAHDERIQPWLVRVKDVFNDAVDVLDEFECEMLRRQVVREYGDMKRKVRSFFSGANPIAFRFSMARKVKDIQERLDEIGRDMAQFQLISAQLNVDEQMSSKLSERMTHSFVIASEIIGRDDDKAAIIDMLLSQDDTGKVEEISVIPIVGLGGLGKTALAKLVYNDSKVTAEFDLKLWVCVSQDFDVTRLLREILKGIKTGEDVSKMSIEELQISVRINTKGKKLLLVLDDIWNEDRSEWIKLREVLPFGKKGSKMIVTARSTLVTESMTSTPPYRLKGLSEESSLSLFFTCASDDEKLAEQHPRLKNIGKAIAGKCGGVPLALKTLGCLLYSKDESEWARLRDHKIWELKREDGHILPALRLSYDTMSPCLKQCFAYCSTFSEDELINGVELVSIWMALGLLPTSNRDMEFEDIGKVQLKELRARSFFQYDDVSENDVKLFNLELVSNYKMHDLVHDLACYVNETECGNVESGKEILSNRVKYLRIYLDENNLTSLRSLKKLWSLHIDDISKYEILTSFISTCITQLRYLRVLDLKKLEIKALPKSFGTFKHLRYLSLLGNRGMKRLPDSICELQSLQTLLLNGCDDLEELPSDIRKLVSLRTLTVTTKQTHFPENGIGCLKSLRTLSIRNCVNLKALPQDMKYCSTLRTLWVLDCGEIDLACECDEIAVELSIRSFFIDKLPKTTELPQWLKGASKTLRNLVISQCENLDISQEWLKVFTSLERLVINHCPEMSCLPEGESKLTSLTHLIVGAPSSAFYERYQPEVGSDWASISHIPNICIESPKN